MSRKPEVLQLFDEKSHAYTYLLWDHISKESIIIDPVLEQFDRDMGLIEELDLRLRYIFETHIHADHVTSSDLLRSKTKALIALSKFAGVECADVQIDDGQEFNFGAFQIRAIHSPGHTAACITYECEENLFTGDALLIRKCGRTDFQEGNSQVLFQSVRDRLFKFPNHYCVYPGHDDRGVSKSTILQEKKFNERLSEDISEDQFVHLMKNLNLPNPKLMDTALPRNLNCGKRK
ncbi:MBL fold metallo-hydrolase [bacterium]|nr:MBL fold metallo-hydrolase [bacterium]